MSGTGWTTPISLFAHWTDTRAVSSVSAPARSAMRRMPSGSTGRSVTRHPSFRRRASGFRLQWCSMASRIRCPGVPRSSIQRSQTPRSARVFPSLPLATNTISCGSTPIMSAIIRRDASIAARARRPAACGEDGLPHASRAVTVILSRTSGSGGVVAAWSR